MPSPIAFHGHLVRGKLCAEGLGTCADMRTVLQQLASITHSTPTSTTAAWRYSVGSHSSPFTPTFIMYQVVWLSGAG